MEEPTQDEIEVEVGLVLHKVNQIRNEAVKEFIKSEIEHYKKVFDDKPKRTKEYPCDNCVQNMCRIEIERLEKLLV